MRLQRDEEREILFLNFALLSDYTPLGKTFVLKAIFKFSQQHD